jgi:hypothetical protein
MDDEIYKNARAFRTRIYYQFLLQICKYFEFRSLALAPKISPSFCVYKIAGHSTVLVLSADFACSPLTGEYHAFNEPVKTCQMKRTDDSYTE